MTEIELLAPARDLECGKVAVDCGADAVYIGAPQFGARHNAGNSLEDIKALVEYAHKYWVRVLVTVNTILRDDEIEPAVRMVHDLYNIGVDGIIVQDFGLLECDLPPISIMASTQMQNDSPDKVAFLSSIGIRRVVLARELSLDEIRAIHEAAPDVELEAFVHGAVCVAESGKCYLSLAFGDRSGNRGNCGQPCRKPYDLVDGDGKTLVKNKHLLSIRDLDLSANLRELIDAGVVSFKIEGRLKGPDYVANVVTDYRRQLDEVLAETGLRKSSSGTVHTEFVADTFKTFNRGFTLHMLHGRTERVGSQDTPKMVGEPVGRVVSIKKTIVDVELASPTLRITRGDGLSFFDRAGVLRGAQVVDVTTPEVGKKASHMPRVTLRLEQRDENARTGVLDGVSVGTLLHRNHDQAFQRTLKETVFDRRIAVEMTLTADDAGFILNLIDENGVRGEARLDVEKVFADKPDAALAGIRTQLTKTGGTEFECANCTIDLDAAYFLPASQWNALRRAALDDLRARRLEARPIMQTRVERNDVQYPSSSVQFEANVLNKRSQAFYERHGVTVAEPAAETGLDMRGRRLMTTAYCIKYELGACKRFPLEGQDGLDSAHPDGERLREPLSLTDDDGRRFQLRFDCRNCRMEVWLPGSEDSKA
jgi:putative protease